MKNDEKPRCVTGPAPGDDRRVAGESKLAPSATQPFRLVRKSSEPAKTCKSGAYYNTKTYYSVDTCNVPRFEGIEKFDARGEVKDNYVSYYTDFSEIGPQGPQGAVWGSWKG